MPGSLFIKKLKKKKKKLNVFKEDSIATFAAVAFECLSQWFSKLRVCVYSGRGVPCLALSLRAKTGLSLGVEFASQADGLHQLNLAMKAACVGELKVCV